MELANSLNNSGLEIFRHLFLKDMISFSPLSCGLALTGVLQGTSNNASKELAHALRITDFDQIDNFRQINSVLNNKSDHTVIKLVTALYIQNNFQLGEEFLSKVCDLIDVRKA